MQTCKAHYFHKANREDIPIRGIYLHYINQTIRHPPHTRAVEFASPRRNNEHFCSM